MGAGPHGSVPLCVPCVMCGVMLPWWAVGWGAGRRVALIGREVLCLGASATAPVVVLVRGWKPAMHPRVCAGVLRCVDVMWE